MKTSRRKLLGYGAKGMLAVLAGPVTSVKASDAPRAPIEQQLQNEGGSVPVHTLNGWTLPYTMKNGVKEFHLVAEEIEHEFGPGTVANVGVTMARLPAQR